MTTLPLRKDVKLEDTWKLEDIFETDDLFKTCLKNVTDQLPGFSSYKGQLTKDPETLLKFLKAQDQLSEDFGKLYVYAHMRLHQDGSNSFYQDLSLQTENLGTAVSEALAFVSPELSSLTAETLNQFYQSCPSLKLYERYFNELLRQKAHILDDQTEALLAQVGELASVPQNTFAMLNNVELDFPDVKDEEGKTLKLTHGNYIPLMESQDRSVRQNAFEGLYKTYEGKVNTIASLFAGNVKQAGFFARTRHFSSALEAALSENNIPLSVYHNLIQTVNDHMDVLHDYMKLRKDTLELDTLHMYDLFVPMVKNFKKTISYEEAQAIILDALAPLGEDYLSHVKEGFNNRWIDKYENKGKRSGAYSWGTYGAPHPYILLNYTPNVNNVFTLVHEMGHAMHSYYSSKNQPSVYADYCIFVAEVASTVNEALLMQYLLKTTTDKDFKKYLVNYFMDQFKSTLYRQTMFAEFELKMHSLSEQGVPLTSQLISDNYYELVKKYHGSAVTVDEAIRFEWSRIPHFYTPYYVYQYATGYSAAIALSTRILNEGEPAVKDYLAFLSGGSSKDPIDLLKIAGVDMSSPLPIEQALKQFETLITDFKKL